MNQDEREKIYTRWCELENSPETQILVNPVIRNKPISMKYISPTLLNERDKYRKWVLRYCPELIPDDKKCELEDYVKDKISCVCEDSNCAKCLLVNCKDDDCYYHPIDRKESFKLRYNNR